MGGLLNHSECTFHHWGLGGGETNSICEITWTENRPQRKHKETRQQMLNQKVKEDEVKIYKTCIFSFHNCNSDSDKTHKIENVWIFVYFFWIIVLNFLFQLLRGKDVEYLD